MLAIALVTAFVLAHALAGTHVIAMAYGAGAGAGDAPSSPTATAPQLRSSAPLSPAADGLDRGFAGRVTISPNGDGVNDSAIITVCGATGTLLKLRVFHWGHGRQGRRSWDEIYNSPPASPTHNGPNSCGTRGQATFRWQGTVGSTTGDRAPDSSYRVTVCTSSEARSSRQRSFGGTDTTVAEIGNDFLRDAGENIDDKGIVPADEADHAPKVARTAASPTGSERETPEQEAAETRSLVKAAKGKIPEADELTRPEGARGCIAKAVLVDVRRASIAIKSSGSFLPGTDVPLDIALDSKQNRANATVQIEGGGSLADAPIASAPAAANKLRIPNVLATGLYRVRLHVPAVGNRPELNRCVPLVVRSSSISVTAPPAKTALVVWPYLTWRAYNQFDADSNGISDTWYSRWKNRQVSLVGPYERLAQRDGCNVVQPFTDWSQATPGRSIQSITDVELARLPQSAINRYASIWYPDHSEYFEGDSYHKLMRYRAQHGNLVFLSANNFFRKVHIDTRRNTMRLAALQERKDISTDYRLVGVGFDACCFPRAQFGMYTVGIGALKAPWVFDGTNLGVGDQFGINGLEVDTLGRRYDATHVTTVAQSTMHLTVGHDAVATMATIDWPGGGTTFATGNMVFTLMLRTPSRAVIVSRILDNVWAHTTDPGEPAAG